MKRKVRADLRGSMDNVVSGMLKYAGKEIDLDDRSSAYGYYWGEHMLEPLQSESYQITKDRILAAASKCPDAKATLEVLFPDAFEKKPITWNSMKWYCPKHTAITERRTDNIVLDWSVDGKFSLNTNRFDYKINNDELVITPK